MPELEAPGSGRSGAGGAGGAVARGAECTCLLCIATPSGEQLLHELSTDAGSLDHVSLGCCEDDIVKQLLLGVQEGGVILWTFQWGMPWLRMSHWDCRTHFPKFCFP